MVYSSLLLAVKFIYKTSKYHAGNQFCWGEKMVHIFHNYEGAEDSKFFGDRAVVDFNTKSI
jgi:hypothetical protein